MEASRPIMQYTLRNIPPELDAALRERARREGRSLNEIAVEALRRDAGLTGERPRKRDLSSFAGTWIEDPAVEEALSDQRRIDERLWR